MSSSSGSKRSRTTGAGSQPARSVSSQQPAADPSADPSSSPTASATNVTTTTTSTITTTQQQSSQPANPRKRRASPAPAAAEENPSAPATAAEPTPTEGTAAAPAAGATTTAPPKKKGRTNTPWTAEEEQRLKAMRDAGKSWSEIAKSFPTRTEGSVKKHWYKDMHYAEFAEEEAIALREAIKEYEANKWKVIGQKVGKPAKACEQYAKEHFKNL